MSIPGFTPQAQVVKLTTPADVATVLTVETLDVLGLEIKPLVVALDEGPASQLALFDVVANCITIRGSFGLIQNA